MMDKVATVIRLLILVLCVLLFWAGALWNLCVQPEQTAATEDVSVQTESTEVLLNVQDTAASENTAQDAVLQSRMAALRMERDTAWQQLYQAVESLEFAEKQQVLHQYAELQYLEQKLELLLSAKGLHHTIALLGPQQANIIIPAEALQQEYEKVFDLVLRNTEYDETQIILVPLE